MRSVHRATPGFTLIEVVVAIVVLAIGVLALAASAAATVRSMTDGARTSGIARAAESARERAYATVCGVASGSDSASGARVTWNASPAGAMLLIHQVVTLSPTSTPATITAVGACR